jgi:hypothetical protein
MNAVRTDETVRQLSVVQTELDDQRYKSEKERLARDSGVPPYITELAKPLLHGSNHVVELSGGTSADAGQIMRKVLTEFGKMTSMLGADVELGSPMDEPEGQGQAEQAASREQFVGTYLDQFRMR